MFGELIEQAKTMIAEMLLKSEARARVRTRYLVAGSLYAETGVEAQDALDNAKILEALVYEDAADDLD